MYKSKIAPCLWFDGKAEDAARFYVRVFKGKLGKIARYGKAGREAHGQPEGRVMTVEFTILGMTFTALNAGPLFKFNEAVSFQVPCDTQKQIDYYWNALGQGGNPRAQVCGWLKDRFGLSWQIFPRMMGKWMSDPDPEKAGRTMNAMIKMKKMDLAALKKAHAGK